MVRLLVYIKHHLAFIWSWVEWGNSFLFNLLYGKKLRKAIPDVLDKIDSEYQFRWLRKEEMSQLADFFTKQSDSAYEFFKPHGFDLKSLVSKNKDKSFIMIGAFSGNEMVGYCFLRCFFNKHVFRGKIVDIQYQGRGIAKMMGRLTTEICQLAGFRLFATISRNNVKSISSSKAVNDICIIKELPNDYLYVEYLLKR